MPKIPLLKFLKAVELEVNKRDERVMQAHRRATGLSNGIIFLVFEKN